MVLVKEFSVADVKHRAGVVLLMNTERGHALFPDRLLSSIVLIPYQSDCQEGAIGY
jgi:hypothetical protein